MPFKLVNIWTDAEPGPAAFSPMPDSLLWTPAVEGSAATVPGFVLVARWGGYPYGELARACGPALASLGCACLSLGLRRRGVEGALLGAPDDDLLDIKLAVDYLQLCGCGPIYLLGEELGGHSVLRYAAQTLDSRVRGCVWSEPVAEPAAWLQATAGEHLAAAFDTATVAVRQGAGAEQRIELDARPTGPHVVQQAQAFLQWWSPDPAVALAPLCSAMRVPLLTVAPAGAKVPAVLTRQDLHEHQVAATYGTMVPTIMDWAERQGCHARAMPTQTLVTVERDGREFSGLLWRPSRYESSPERCTVTVLMHGLSSNPLSPLFMRMAPHLAQHNNAVLAIETHRSGWAGHENAVADDDLDDIDAWLRFLRDLGYQRIVLAGASMGSISIGRYYARRRPQQVVALAHLMPTADCPDWFRRAAGDGPYASAVERATAAVAAGQGDTVLIDIDVRQPAPARIGGRFRWTQRAASWLSWWGPAADTVNTAHIAAADVPVLLLSGTDDSYNDVARFAELRAAAVNAPRLDEIWYPGIDHGLVNAEEQAANDLLSWLQTIGVVSAG